METREAIERELCVLLVRENMAPVTKELVGRMTDTIMQAIDNVTVRDKIVAIREKYITDCRSDLQPNAIPVVKEVRMLANLPLKDAKDLVDLWSTEASRKTSEEAALSTTHIQD